MAGINIGKYSKTTYSALVILFALSSLLFFISPTITLADTVQYRSVVLSTNLPNQIASHDFQFYVPDISTLGSITFEYCSNSPLFDNPCTAPAGLDVSGAVLSSQTGNAGFNVNNVGTTANMIEISRVPSLDSIDTTTYDFGNIQNPSTPGETEYIRIALYPTADASGAYSDNGAVAFAVADTFTVGATVPPFIRICVGVTVSLNCSSSSGSSIDLGDLSDRSANTAQTQFSAGTNSINGYDVFAQGNSMTSGNNAIPTLASPSPSVAGTSQFGINLRSNSSPSSGQDPAGPGTATPTANYDTPNLFTYNDGDLVASSPLPSDYNLMTVSYLINVSSKQPDGVYGSTITYLAVAQF